MSISPQPLDTGELLSTKLTAPYLRAPLVTRQPLLERLEAGLQAKLILVSAPAGFGKTTLVSQWIENVRTVGHPNDRTLIAWVSLDHDDNDPVRFWRYALTACLVFNAEVSKFALAILNNSPQPPFEYLLADFINQAARLEGRSMLVLDDYHVITESQIHKTLSFFLEHLPPTLHVILMTRSDPPLPLGRMRARNELHELRAEDLRFSLDETGAFIEQSIPAALSPEIVTRLAQRTEGWIAGLHLAVLALRRRTSQAEIQQFLKTFSGSLRPIQDYLVEEVLGAQTKDIQEFLLQTSFLNRLTGSLCDDVTGRDDSSILLNQLERANLFLVSTDAAGLWYRYHALFSEALQNYARQRLEEAQLRLLQHKASLWYEEHGMLREAIEAALASLNTHRAAGLIQRFIEPFMDSNEKHTLRRWMEQIPEEVLRAHPTICMTFAMAILFTSDRHAPATKLRLQTPLQIAEEHWRSEGNQPRLGEVLALRSLVDWLQRDLSESFSLAREALKLLPEGERQWRGITLVLIGGEELYAGRMHNARTTFLEARGFLEANENIYGVLDSTLYLGLVCYEQGELRQATHFFRQVIARLEKAPMDRDRALVRRRQALLGLGTLALEVGDLQTADQYVTEGVAISQQFPDDFPAYGPLVPARIKVARGELKQAQDLLGELAAQAKFPLQLREVRAYQARLSLARGDLAAVQRWSGGIEQQADDTFNFYQEQEALVVARLLIAQKQEGEALQLLEDWLSDARANGRVRSEMEIRILMALAHAALDDLPQAKQALVQALELAQPEGYRRLFLDEGEPMAEILGRALSEMPEGSLASFTRALLYARAQETSRGYAPQSGSLPFIEPLSEQEQRVLRLIGEGLTNPEIARELVVSLNTVKTHVKSIYRKLNLSNRREARQAARQLNLV